MGTASALASSRSPSPSEVNAATPARDGGEDARSEPPPELTDVRTDWCLEGWRALEEGTCWLVPDRWSSDGVRRLVIYLSGIVPPVPKSHQKENVQRVVASSARRAGVAVLLPRGRRGIGPPGAKDWWAWPTRKGDYDASAATMVAEWTAARVKLESSFGPFHRTYLAGSSSGAYFLVALALRGAFVADGYAAISGGASFIPRDRLPSDKRPFYVGYASGDPSRGGPKALGALLSSAGWPVRVVEHPGGHGTREVYLDEAISFWMSLEGDGGQR